MKTKFLLLFLLISGIVMAGCNQKKQYRPDGKIVKAFTAKYPQAKKVEWEQKQGYYVAEFHHDNVENEVWYDQNGNWRMTESNIKYNSLPQAIRNSFENSDYKNWKREDVDKIERPGTQTIYILEIENNGKDMDLYYTENGRLVKTVADTHKGKLVGYMPVKSNIQDMIKQKYPDAVIVETDMEKGKYEVDIMDNGKMKEVIFDGNNWEATYWEVNKSEVPTAVMDAFRKSTYNNYRIDEIHYYETPAKNYYHFELEQGDKDAYLSIDPTGKIIE